MVGKWDPCESNLNTNEILEVFKIRWDSTGVTIKAYFHVDMNHTPRLLFVRYVIDNVYYVTKKTLIFRAQNIY